MICCIEKCTKIMLRFLNNVPSIDQYALFLSLPLSLSLSHTHTRIWSWIKILILSNEFGDKNSLKKKIIMTERVIFSCLERSMLVFWSFHLHQENFMWRINRLEWNNAWKALVGFEFWLGKIQHSCEDKRLERITLPQHRLLH